MKKKKKMFHFIFKNTKKKGKTIGDAGATALAEAMKGNTSLSYLNLASKFFQEFLFL